MPGFSISHYGRSLARRARGNPWGLILAGVLIWGALFTLDMS